MVGKSELGPSRRRFFFRVGLKYNNENKSLHKAGTTDCWEHLVNASLSTELICSVLFVSMLTCCAKAAPPAAPRAVAIMPSAATPVPPVVPSWTQIDFIVETDANPDIRGRASPVIIKTYELRSATAFNAADYF